MVEHKTLTTAEAAEVVGINYHYLLSQLASNRIHPKPAQINNRYLWTPWDVDSLCRLIHKQSFEEYMQSITTSPINHIQG